MLTDVVVLSGSSQIRFTGTHLHGEISGSHSTHLHGETSGSHSIYMGGWFAILEVYGIHMRNPKNKKSADSFLSHATINSFS